MGLRTDLNPDFLNQAGWGLVLPEDADPAILKALDLLLVARRKQAEKGFRVFHGETGLRMKESKNDWLARMGAGPGPADPNKVPYYLLLAGDPVQIPFSFQSQLDVQYAVGRIHFDTLEEYARYAESVLRVETITTVQELTRGKEDLAAQISEMAGTRSASRGLGSLPPRLFMLAPQHNGDPFTAALREGLVRPLVKELQQTRLPEWTVTLREGEMAGRIDFARALGGADRSALVLTAGHGLALPLDHPRQEELQGGLVCQEWEPREKPFGLTGRHYVSADSLPESAALLGQVTVHISSFSAGTPVVESYEMQATGSRAEILFSERPFVSRLAQRMLAHPNGGSMAFIGLTERVASCAFDRKEAFLPFYQFLHMLMRRKRVGLAFEVFNQAYAETSSALTDELTELTFGKFMDPPAQERLVQVWWENQLLRSLVLLGDPAARVMV